MIYEIYTQKIDELLELTKKKKEDVFLFDFSIYRNEFENVFSFYQEALERKKNYGIVKNIFYFNNCTTINAVASKENDVYTVSMNMGTIVYLIQTFLETDNLLDINKHKAIIEFEKLLDTSIQNLMYQNVVHYTFYHELAHLIQNSDSLLTSLEEKVNNKSIFSLESHILELDADEFSALNIGAHLFDYADRILGDRFNLFHFEILITLFGSSIFLYLKMLQCDSVEIYLKEKSHPHSIIRFANIMFTLTRYCSNLLEYRGIFKSVSEKEIYLKILTFSDQLSDIVLKNTHCASNYLKIFNDNYDNINGYFEEVNKEKQNNKSLAVFKRNQIIKKTPPNNGYKI